MDGKHLRGSTWDHPRAYEPLRWLATHAADLGIAPVDWQIRTLSNFADQSLDCLVRDNDLIVLDHPFIGQAAQEGLLLDLSSVAAPDSDFVGPSAQSYVWQGRTYALPIDAACHVAVTRPDLTEVTPNSLTWDEVEEWSSMQFACHGPYVSIPQAPIDLWCLLVTLLASQTSLALDGDRLASVIQVAAAVERIQHLAWLSNPVCRTYNPIELLDHMSQHDDIIASPAIFGYVNYSIEGFRSHLLSFQGLPCGSRAILGGAGIAVSAFSADPALSVSTVMKLTSSAVQCGWYASHGGQPAHRAAWLDPKVDQSANGFFSNTLDTIDRSFLRPRWPGFIEMSKRSSTVLKAAVDDRLDPVAVANDLICIYSKSAKKRTEHTS